MIDKIRIKNFKSLRDVRLNLQQVNLLIGPNNSGKTNFLKALEFFGKFYQGDYNDKENFNNVSFRKAGFYEIIKEIHIIEKNEDIDEVKHAYYKLEEFPESYEIPKYNFLSGKFGTETMIINDFSQAEIDKIFNSSLIEKRFAYMSSLEEISKLKWNSKIQFNSEQKTLPFYGFIFEKLYDSFNLWKSISKSIRDFEYIKIVNPLEDLIDIKIYKPDINKIKLPAEIKNKKETAVSADVSNLIPFLDSMLGGNIEVIEAMNKDLNNYISEFVKIRVDYKEIPNIEEPHKIIGLTNKKNETFWGDEISDGTLYFLALLSIVHQPNPPKLLLIEEPEANIHPRRIKEVIDLLFDLANKKGIQVILTTHSPLVVDEFRDIPESVHIFEMEDGESIVKNLKLDIINKLNGKSKNKGFKEVDYTVSLGDNWILGFLGGVPK